MERRRRDGRFTTYIGSHVQVDHVKAAPTTEAGADCSGVSCGRSRDAESEPGRTAERAEGMPAAQRRAVMTVLVVFMMTMVVDANECTDMRDAGWSLKMCGDGRRRCDGFKH